MSCTTGANAEQPLRTSPSTRMAIDFFIAQPL
jgi:hypothetical protein